MINCVEKETYLMPMNISIIGAGRIGFVSGACFAKLGNNVICQKRFKNNISNLKSVRDIR